MALDFERLAAERRTEREIAQLLGVERAQVPEEVRRLLPTEARREGEPPSLEQLQTALEVARAAVTRTEPPARLVDGLEHAASGVTLREPSGNATRLAAGRKVGAKDLAMAPVWRDYVAVRQALLDEVAGKRPPSAESARAQALESELVTAYAGLVDARVKRYGLAGDARDELVSAGLAALHRAIRSYDPERVPFTLYAHMVVRHAVGSAVGRELTGLEGSALERRRQIDRVVNQLMQELQRPPRTAEIARALGVDVALYERWRIGQLGRRSFDAPHEDAANRTLHDEVADAGLREQAEQLDAVLAKAIAELEGRERTVAELAFREQWLDTEIAAAAGVSRERVSQIRERVLEKLRPTLDREGLSPSTGTARDHAPLTDRERALLEAAGPNLELLAAQRTPEEIERAHDVVIALPLILAKREYDNPGRAITRLIELAKARQSETFLRHDAIGALRQAAIQLPPELSAQAAHGLGALLAPEHGGSIRKAALEALAAVPLRSFAVDRTLLQLLTDGDTRLRNAAYDVLRSHPPRWREELEPVLAQAKQDAGRQPAKTRAVLEQRLMTLRALMDRATP
jgi:RNA polymerase sigma factor (sigma-70 family)